MAMIRTTSQLFMPSKKTENSGRPQIRYLENDNPSDWNTFRNIALYEDIGLEAGSKLSLSINPQTYELTISLKNKENEILSSGSVDLPIESMVIGASYEDGKIILTLQSGQTLEIDISDIVDGLVNDVKVNGTSVKDSDGVANITVPTQLSDLTADSTHRTVTDAEKTTWNGKQDALTFDNTPTANSDNPVKSKGILSALNGKLGTSGDGQNVTVTFSQGTKVDVATDFATGSKLSTLFGKIKAWFASLKGLAFKDKTETGDYTEGSIYNGDIADSARIAQSKIDGLTSALNGKQATITGAATTITSSNLTASRALISNGSGKVAVSDITSTELGYLDGVTSNIQTQLNNLERIDITGQTLDLDTLNLSSGNPYIARYICKTTGGSSNIAHKPTANNPFILDVEIIRWASTSDYITRQTFRSNNNAPFEWQRTNTSGTWSAWIPMPGKNYIVICETAAATQIKEVSLPNFTLTNGTMLSVYFVNKNSVSSPKLRINSNNAADAKDIYINNAAATNANLNAGWVTLYYNGTRWYGGYFIPLNCSDANQSYKVRQNTNIIASTNIVAGNTIYAKSDNKYAKIDAGVAINTLLPILYAGSNINANQTGSNNYLHQNLSTASIFGSGTSFPSSGVYAPVFLKGNMNGNIFTLVSSGWWTQTIPTTEDGFQYMLIGYAYSTTQVRLFPEHPIYEFKGGAFGLYEKRNNTCARGVDDSSNYAGYFKIAETTLSAWYRGSKAKIIVSDFDDPNTAILTVTAQINNNGDTSVSRIGITETTSMDRWNGRFFLVIRQNSSVNISEKKVELWYKNPSNLTYQRITATFIYDNPNNRYSGNHNNIEWTKFYRTSAQDKSYVSAGLTDLTNGYIPEGGWSTAFSGDTTYPNYTIISDNLTDVLQMSDVRLGTTYKYYLPPVGLTQYETESYLAVNKGVSLWVGSIASGSITLPTQATKYAVFRISFGDDSSTFNTEIIATKRGSASDTVRGIGGYRPTTNGALQIYDVSFTISGNTWTLVTATRNDFNLNTSSGNITGYRTAGYIKQIIGVC